MSEKKRSKNFSDKEAVALMSLISEKKTVLENKKTDGVTNLEKNEAWQKVADAFNASCPESTARSVDSIRKWWDNKKRIIRKEKGDERKEVLLTGGGPPPSKTDPHSDLVLSIIDPETVVGGEGPFGSDGQTFPSLLPSNSDMEADDYYFYELEEAIDKPSSSNSEPSKKSSCSDIQRPDLTRKSNWQKHCMSDLMQPKNSALKRPVEENRTINQIARPGSTLEEEKRQRILDRTNNTATDENLEIESTVHKTVTVDAQKNKRPLNRRRPNATVVRSLASNELAEKYNILVDKKTLVTELTLKNLKEELETNKKAQKLRMEALELDVQIKKEKLKSLQRENNN